MFTGIIEETGYVKKIVLEQSSGQITIVCKKILDDIKLGDSISIDGCCQTVIDFDETSFKTQISRETLDVTTFKNFKSGDMVNLERALTPQSRMGGHFVQGHVDCTAKFLSKVQTGDFYEMYFELPEDELKYIVHKGSIAINGVSLTIAAITQYIVKIAVVPHTFENTNLSNIVYGDFVNIETDILGRYVENFLHVNNNMDNITKDFLQENGFI